MTWVDIAVAAAAAVVSVGAQQYNAGQVAKKQDSTLAASLTQQGITQRDQNAKTSALIAKTANSTPAAAKATLLDQFTQQMNNNKAASTANLDQVGAVSSAYTKAANDASTGISDYGTQQAGLMASMTAPGLQRAAEGQNLSQYATDLNETKRVSSADQFLTQMQLNGIKPNAWLTGLSDAAGSYSKAMAGNAGMGASTTGTGTALNDGTMAPAQGFGSLYDYQPVYGGGL